MVGTNLWYFSKPHWISWDQTQIHTIGLSTLGVNDFEDSYCQGHFYLVLFPSTTEGHPVCDLDGRFTWGGCVRIHIHIELLQTVFLLFVAQHMFPVKMGPYVGFLGWPIDTQISVSSWMARDLPTSGSHAQIGATEKEPLGWCNYPIFAQVLSQTTSGTGGHGCPTFDFGFTQWSRGYG